MSSYQNDSVSSIEVHSGSARFICVGSNNNTA